MSFPKQLKILLKENKITQKQLADALGIPASTLSSYVQGTNAPSLDTLVSIAEFFKVSTDYLLEFPSPCIHKQMEEDLLQVFRALSPDDQIVYLEEGKAFLRINHTQKN